MLEKRSLSYNGGPIPVPLDEPFLADNVQRICVCDTGLYLLFVYFQLSVWWLTVDFIAIIMEWQDMELNDFIFKVSIFIFANLKFH